MLYNEYVEFLLESTSQTPIDAIHADSTIYQNMYIRDEIRFWSIKMSLSFNREWNKHLKWEKDANDYELVPKTRTALIDNTKYLILRKIEFKNFDSYSCHYDLYEVPMEIRLDLIKWDDYPYLRRDALIHIRWEDRDCYTLMHRYRKLCCWRKHESVNLQQDGNPRS